MVAVAEAVGELAPGVRVVFAGTERGIEARASAQGPGMVAALLARDTPEHLAELKKHGVTPTTVQLDDSKFKSRSERVG